MIKRGWMKTKEITVRLTVKQAQAAWRMLSTVEGGCEDGGFQRSCETGCRRITRALQKAEEKL